MKARKKFLLAAALGLLLVTWAGPVLAQSIYVDYYTPQFYGDYLVFYDESGAPIYYEDNYAYAVPGDYPDYEELINHFLDNEDAYFQWFEDVGYENLHYRRTPIADYYKPRYYNGYIVFFEDGQPVYYVDGDRNVIRRTDRRYPRLMRHFRKHRDDYRRWYRSTGRHYRWYFRPVYTDYYSPLWHDGYLIYFDVSGLPFYYHQGRTIYIPRRHKRYHDYVSHYRSHRHKYDRWYKERGRKYHKYRKPKSRRKPVIAPKAPRARHGRAEKRKYRPKIRPHRKPTIVPKPHSPPPPRVKPKHHRRHEQPRPSHVTPPRRPQPPVRADKPRPVAPGIRTKPAKVHESRKPPRPPKPGKPIKPPKPPKKKKKKKHGR